MSLATITVDVPDSILDPICQLIETRSLTINGASIQLDERCVLELSENKLKILQGVSVKFKGLTLRATELIVRREAGKRSLFVDIVHSPIDLVIR